jgi:hypothetical protein
MLLKLLKVFMIKLVNNENLLSPGISGNFNHSKKYKSVGFDFSDDRYVHIGDSLFFEPILNNFKKNGFDVKVAPPNSMKNYFSRAGYMLCSPSEAALQDLLISTIWMKKNLFTFADKLDCIYLNTTSSRISSPVSNFFVDTLFNLLKVDCVDKILECKPYIPISNSPLFLDGLFFLYADSVDSGKWRIQKRLHLKLQREAKAKLLEGYKIIRIGSKSDLISNPNILPFPHLDYRGETSVLDIFSLMNSPNVVGSISFDTAIAHISLLYCKEANICLKKSSKKHSFLVKKYILPSYIINYPSKIKYL